MGRKFETDLFFHLEDKNLTREKIFLFFLKSVNNSTKIIYMNKHQVSVKCDAHLCLIYYRQLWMVNFTQGKV